MPVKPVWFLDVDGVLNAVGRRPPIEREGTWQYTPCKAAAEGKLWDINYAQEVVDFINTMHGTELLEVRWLTTWAHDANAELSSKLGIKGPFEVAGVPESLGYLKWWKLNRMKEFAVANPHTPIIWTDDDITSVAAAVEWVDGFGGDILAICPNTRDGLTAEDLRAIAQFVLDCSGDFAGVEVDHV